MNMIIKSIASETQPFGKSSSASTSSTPAVAEAVSRFRSLRTANSSTSQAATVSFSEQARQAQQALRSLSEQAPSGLADYALGTTSFNRQQVLVQSGIQPLSVANQQPRESKLMLKI